MKDQMIIKENKDNDLKYRRGLNINQSEDEVILKENNDNSEETIEYFTE